MKKRAVLALGILLTILRTSEAGPAQKRLQVELYGGLAAIAPSDLNSIPESLAAYFRFYYVDRYDHYRKVGYIRDYETKSEGRLRSLRMGFPVGVRVRYRVASFLELSLGVRGFWGSVDSTYTTDVRVINRDGHRSDLRRVYDPLKISASGITPLFGLHLRRKVGNRIGLEAFLAGGPFFGSILYSRKSHSESSGAVSDSFLEEKGRGVGIALDGGLRLETPVSRDLALFIETGYAFQSAGGFKGEGLLRTGSGQQTWESEWGMKEDYLADYWGTLGLLTASNSWTTEDTPLRRRDFRLDLSGVQVRLGIAVRL
jgi:hypothetical protein